MQTDNIPDRFLPFFKKVPLLSLIGNTPFVEIPIFKEELPHCRFFAKVESVNPGGSIKDRPVRRMLLEALLAGELGHNRTLLDSSSGNAGIAYAMIGAALGIPVALVVPANASAERKRRILAHGATLYETPARLGYDAALHEAHRLHDSDPDRYFMPDQYKNAHNWRAHYEETAVEILQALRPPTGGSETTEHVVFGNTTDVGATTATNGSRGSGVAVPPTSGSRGLGVAGATYFVAGVGTGGTITGVGRRLKEEIEGVRVVMTVPEVFPGIEGLKPLDAPNAIIPEIFDAHVVDEQMPVTVEEAYGCCARLAREVGLFLGQSSGAFLKAAYKVAQREQQGVFVTIFSDLGERYFSAGLWDK